MRYKVERVPFYRVVDTEAAEEAGKVASVLHYEGSDKEFADRLAADLNTNHENGVTARERIQADALKQHALEIAESGLGVDK